MSRKHDRKKLHRTYGGDPSHIDAVVRKRQAELAEWIDQKGGAEAVHRKHLSAIVAAKPRKKGRVTAPDNPYRGATVEEYEKLYIVTPPSRRGLGGTAASFGGDCSDNEFFTTFAPMLGGFKSSLLVSATYHQNEDGTRGAVKSQKSRTVYVLPKSPAVEGFVRKLSVFWG